MFKKILDHLEEIVGVICFAAMGLISFANVITRYVFQYSMAFTEEITIYLYVWVVLLGASMAFREGANLTVSFLHDRMPKGVKKLLDLLAYIIALVFFVVLIYYSATEVKDEIEVEAMTEAIELPMWWFTGAMPVCSVLIMARILGCIWDLFHTKAESKPAEAGEGA